MVKAFRDMKYEQCKAEACLYYAWTVFGLILWVTWVNDCLVVGNPEGVKVTKERLMARFDCDEVGSMDEYVGCKLERNFEDRWIKITQPVLLQSFSDEFGVTAENAPGTPAEPGSVLVAGEEADELSPVRKSKYQTGAGKLLHMMRWSIPDILNAVRKLSCFMRGK